MQQIHVARHSMSFCMWRVRQGWGPEFWSQSPMDTKGWLYLPFQSKGLTGRGQGRFVCVRLLTMAYFFTVVLCTWLYSFSFANITISVMSTAHSHDSYLWHHCARCQWLSAKYLISQVSSMTGCLCDSQWVWICICCYVAIW
jgi:hypothetical protein